MGSILDDYVYVLIVAVFDIVYFFMFLLYKYFFSVIDIFISFIIIYFGYFDVSFFTSYLSHISLLGGHNDEWSYIINGLCVSELTTCIEDAGPKQVCIFGCMYICMYSSMQVWIRLMYL